MTILPCSAYIFGGALGIFGLRYPHSILFCFVLERIHVTVAIGVITSVHPIRI